MKKFIGLLIITLLCVALLNGCANPDIEKIPPEEMPEKAVMINDTIYYYTGQHVELLRCGVMDGEITKYVSGATLPAENDESNFGKGYEYQYVDEHHIDIIMPEEENAWVRFCDGLCSDDHSQPLTEANFIVPVEENEENCSVPHISECPTGACITDDGADCVPADDMKAELCICGYPLEKDIKRYPGHIRIIE